MQRELAEVRLALVLERKNKRAQSKRSAEAGRSATLYMAVLAVHALSEGTLELATHFWLGQRRQCGCRSEELTPEKARSVTTQWIDTASVEDFHEARSPVTAAGAKAQRAAVQFLSGAGAALWACRMVQEKGHAPSSREIWHERTQLLHASDSEPGRSAAQAASGDTVRSWARRWRKQWLFKKGKVKLRQRFPVEELRAKARICNVCGFWGFDGPSFGTEKRDAFGCHLSRKHHK